MRATARDRGAALLLVLWMIALLSALVGAFALIAGTESLQGRVLVRGLVAENAARAGLEYGLVRVADSNPKRQWLPDGGSLVGGSSGTYSIESRATLPDRRKAVLRAVVRAGGTVPGSAYTPLVWQVGD